MLKSKIHRATVTDSNLHYEGSVTIASDLMEAAAIKPFEKVQVVDINNGARLETYVIEGTRDSGTICINGAAAHLMHKGDIVIIMSYGSFEDAELTGFHPIIVEVDADNKVVSVKDRAPKDDEC